MTATIEKVVAWALKKKPLERWLINSWWMFVHVYLLLFNENDDGLLAEHETTPLETSQLENGKISNFVWIYQIKLRTLKGKREEPNLNLFALWQQVESVEPNGFIAWNAVSPLLLFTLNLPGPSDTDTVDSSEICFGGRNYGEEFSSTTVQQIPGNKFRFSWEQSHLVCIEWPD